MPQLNPFSSSDDRSDDSADEHIANGPYESDDVFFLYHPVTRKTGQRLRDYLGVPGGENCNEQYDVVIRWGSRRRITSPSDEVINPKGRIRANTDKRNSLDVLDDAGIPVPEYVDSSSQVGHPVDGTPVAYPALGRSEQHSQGADINLIMQQRDIELTDNDFFVQYYPTQAEYRVQVFGGEIVKVHEKRLRTEAAREEDYTPYIRNHQKNWVFVNERGSTPDEVREYALNAVDALELDFGAVDVIHTEEHGVKVLEVNTAPTLDENNLRRYGEQIKDSLGLDSVAGMDAVDWSEDENDGGEDND